MNEQNSVQFLFTHACPSIQYRTRAEILGEDPNSPTMQKLQAKILNEPNVKPIFACQKEDGWLGGLFHQGDTREPESGIRYLSEKGVNPKHPAIQAALKALETRGEAFDKGALEHVGKVLDANHVGGSKMIKACVFAYSRTEDVPLVQKQIAEAIDTFQYITIHNIEEVYVPYKDKLVFKKDGIRWPSTYHLRLLSFTQSWRNTENTTMLANAFQNLVDWSPIPEFKVLSKSQIIGSAHIIMNNFNSNLSQLKAGEWMKWFHQIEMIARLGIAQEVPAIKAQIQDLIKLLEEADGIFTKSLSHFYFHKWTDYTGLALEDDWRVKERRMCDLTFRSLLILKYAGML